MKILSNLLWAVFVCVQGLAQGPLPPAYPADTLATLNLDEVVVTGQFEPQSAHKSVYSVRTIPMERIQARGAVKLEDVLNTELNIRFNQDAALGGSNISFQGLSGQNVKILIDGVPMVGRQGTSNEINVNQINVNTVERIEIVEGPMSVVYGADALAGVINIITRKSIDGKLELSARLHTESIGSEYGWKNGLHNESVGIGYAKKGFHGRADISRNYFGGWQGNAVGRDKLWHPKTQYLASGVFGFSKDNFNAYYRADYLYEDIYNPANFEGIEALDQNYFTNRLMHQLQANATLSPKLSVNSALAYTDFQRETRTVTVNSVSGDERLAGKDITAFDGITVRSTAQYKLNSNIVLQPGIDFNIESGSGGRIKAGTQSVGDYAFFFSGEWNVHPRLQIRPGVRMVYNTIYSAPPVIPSINTKFHIAAKHDLRLSYGRGFRAPSLRELYFDFFDASHSIEGNENLQAELSHSINGSWIWQVLKNDRVDLVSSLTAFYNTIDNMIGFGQKASNPQITTYINIDRFKTKGFTLNQTLKVNRINWTVGFGYTGRFNQLSELQAGLNDFVWSPELTSNLAYAIPSHGLRFSLYYKFTGRTPFYELVSNNGVEEARLAEIDSFQWTDVTVQKDFLKAFTATAGVRNLFDITNINNTSLNGTGVHAGGDSRAVGYGRSYFLSLAYSFTK